MIFKENDDIGYLSDGIKHKSAGGFLFYENPETRELSVVLLCTTDGHYVIPKGHLHRGETSKEAAIREVCEELSLRDKPKVISFIGTNEYTFTVDNGGIVHSKQVYIFLFQLDEQVNISPIEGEGFTSAEWLPFEIALKRISFDKVFLLKARQEFYNSRSISKY